MHSAGAEVALAGPAGSAVSSLEIAEHKTNEVAAVADGLPIEIKDGRPCVSSRAVATHFGKQHGHVIRDIDALIAHAPELEGVQFQEVSRPHPSVKGRNDRSFFLDRDGFTLLVMGYTGPLALTFKLAYLRRFNTMEAELRERMARPAPASSTMSSLEVAERTGKRHRNVLADIRVMLVALHGEDGVLRFQQSYRNAQNKLQPCFHLPKRECFVLVTGYSIPMRAAVVDRWQELEAQVAAPAGPALPNFADPAASARAWAERYEGEQRALAAAGQERTLRIAAQAETEALKPANRR